MLALLILLFALMVIIDQAKRHPEEFERQIQNLAWVVIIEVLLLLLLAPLPAGSLTPIFL